MKKFRYLVVSNVELTVSAATQDTAKIYPNIYGSTTDFSVKRIKDWQGNEIVMQLQTADEDLKLSGEE